jgi:cyanate lyase
MDAARLLKRCELADASARIAEEAAERRLAQAREAGEVEMAAAERAAAEREAIAKLAAEEEVRAERARGEAQAAELRRATDRLHVQIRKMANEASKADEARLGLVQKAEVASAERNALQRECVSLRAEASAARERADVLQTTLNQRTQFAAELQAAAEERERTLRKHYADAAASAKAAAAAALGEERARGTADARELRERLELANDQVARLQVRSLISCSHPNVFSENSTFTLAPLWPPAAGTPAPSYGAVCIRPEAWTGRAAQAGLREAKHSLPAGPHALHPSSLCPPHACTYPHSTPPGAPTHGRRQGWPSASRTAVTPDRSKHAASAPSAAAAAAAAAATRTTANGSATAGAFDPRPATTVHYPALLADRVPARGRTRGAATLLIPSSCGRAARGGPGRQRRARNLRLQ